MVSIAKILHGIDGMLYGVNDNDNRMTRKRVGLNFEKQYAQVYTSFENYTTASNAYTYINVQFVSRSSAYVFFWSERCEMRRGERKL